MSDRGSQLLEEALALPPEERADLAERLLSSLDPPQAQVERLWATEAEDRIDAFEQGQIKAISAEEFLRPLHRSST